MSYTLDIYNRKLEPTKDFVSFASFVTFFPQLVAGPIERATNLLPQVLAPRKFNYLQAVEGVKFIVWGMFKKVVIADSIAPAVNEAFANYQQYSSLSLIIGAVGFAFQIYCDFSGYSDIARGVSKLFGFELMVNFDFPYFSRSIAEFWRKWHISLSTWFKDYVYIPLGGSKVGKLKGLRNVFIIFLLSGFWHGANLTFIAWGFLHALLFIPLFIFGANRNHLDNLIPDNKWFPSIRSIINIVITFMLVTIAWVFFRAENINKAFDYIAKMFVNDNTLLYYSKPNLLMIALLVVLDYCVYIFGVKKRKLNVYLEYIVGALLLIAIVIFFNGANNEFIYFDF